MDRRKMKELRNNRKESGFREKKKNSQWKETRGRKRGGKRQRANPERSRITFKNGKKKNSIFGRKETLRKEREVELRNEEAGRRGQRTS